ncbi:MAG: hypothetical protein HGJ94_17260 [Desulfosarcina sp.]|nr:hypothetical protein [Desulfosarcina sp.]MBC2742111.1 hypothetical protein [Desulfosarcina sp.]MBC2765024.1 hypothetical protein [Desulfosarcina sp.]
MSVIKEILTDFLYGTAITLFCLLVFVWCIHVGWMGGATLNCYCDINELFAQYESLGPEMMFDENKD